MAYFTVYKDLVFATAENSSNLFLLANDITAMEYLARLIGGEDYARVLTALQNAYDSDILDKLDDGVTAVALYAEFKELSRNFSRVSVIVTDYVPKVYLTEVTSVQRISDLELSRTYGFINIAGMGVTKYSMQRDVTRHLFFLQDDNLSLHGSFSGLQRGYMYMSFGIQIMILFILGSIAVVASGTIAGEYEIGSIKLLLIRPYKRWKVLTAKLSFIYLLTLILFLFAYGSLLLIAATGWIDRTGLSWDNMSQVLVIFNANTPLIMSQMSVITLEFLSWFIACIMYVTIAVMVSTVFRSRAASVAATIFVFFAGDILTAFLSTYSWYRFIVFNNTFWHMYISSGPSLGDMTLGFSMGMYAIYFVVILVSAYWVFEKRDAV
jgi:ABC-2 type transport system permease protein